jgi:hypothetical protein
MGVGRVPEDSALIFAIDTISHEFTYEANFASQSVPFSPRRRRLISSLLSLSSGTSDKGLDDVEVGLLEPSSLSTIIDVSIREGDFLGVLLLTGWVVPLAAAVGVFLARSQNCSYGKMTLEYEFLICVDRPGIPP